VGSSARRGVEIFTGVRHKHRPKSAVLDKEAQELEDKLYEESQELRDNRVEMCDIISNFLAGGIAVLVGTKAFLDTPGSYSCGAPTNWFSSPSSNTSCDINIRETYSDVIVRANATMLPPLVDTSQSNCSATFDFVAQNFFIGEVSGLVGACNDATSSTNDTSFCINAMFQGIQNDTIANFKENVLLVSGLNADCAQLISSSGPLALDSGTLLFNNTLANRDIVSQYGVQCCTAALDKFNLGFGVAGVVVAAFQFLVTFLKWRLWMAKQPEKKQMREEHRKKKHEHLEHFHHHGAPGAAATAMGIASSVTVPIEPNAHTHVMTGAAHAHALADGDYSMPAASPLIQDPPRSIGGSGAHAMVSARDGGHEMSLLSASMEQAPPPPEDGAF